LSERTIFGYIEAVASDSPTPGAGSVAALTGAMASALGEMVCRISIGSSSESESHPLIFTLQQLGSCRRSLLDLSPQDEAAYAAFRAAQALSRQSKAEQDVRTSTMQEALRVAAEVPLDIARQSVLALESLHAVAKEGSKYTLADIATAAHLLSAAVLGALANVGVNVTMIRDPAMKGTLSASMHNFEARRNASLSRVLETIERR